MRNHPKSHHATIPAVELPFAGVWPFLRDRFLLLPLGAVMALAWANGWPESYFRFAHIWSFPVNEIGMALFLALVAHQMLESVMPGGALHTWRRWGLAVSAGVGGFLGAAGVFMVYVQFKHETLLSIAWPVAGAIDIAAGYFMLKTIWHRSSALPLLLGIAIVGDAIGLSIVTARGALLDLQAGGIALAIVAVSLAAIMRLGGVASLWPYLLITGPISWFGLFWAGLHPALALVPIVPFLPREARRRGPFVAAPEADELRHQENNWSGVVQIVLFLFGLVNAGLLLRSYDTGTWAILTASLVGRPLGILIAAAMAVAMGMTLPPRLGWRGLVVVALATTSGFTFALFFATGAMPMGPALDQIKLGALATAIGAVITIGTARLLRVGRFARVPERREAL